MKTDVYTKIILTGIFIALVANFFKGTDIVATAQAQSVQLAPAAITEQPKPIDVNIVSLNGEQLLLRWINMKDGSKRALLPMSLEYSDETLDVTMKKYEHSNSILSVKSY